MKTYFKLPLYAVMSVMLSMGVMACSDNDDVTPEGELTPREAALKNVINDYTKNTVVPTYEGLSDAAIELHTACLAMYNSGVGNVTTAQVEAAGKAWKETREYWERSEAWLFGPAGTYDVDPHIDSWPLDKAALDKLLANKTEMAKMDNEGVYVSSQDYGLLGFHALEYMLFALEGTGISQTSVAHSTNYTAEELSYIAGVAGDLRNQCIILEASWRGEKNISSAKQQVLTHVRELTAIAQNNQNYKEALDALANGLCYTDQMNNPVEGSTSNFLNYLEGAETMIVDGIQNIANEVGNIKIGNPTGQGLSDETEYDPDYIESPYSLNSINDFKGNIISIENAYRGLQSSQSYNMNETLIKPVTYSLSNYVATLDATLDNRVKAAITDAYNAINEMKEPFAYTCDRNGAYAQINKNAIEACNELNDIFSEVLRLLQSQR